MAEQKMTVQQAIETLRKNIRDAGGSVTRLGIYDNDDTRDALAALMAPDALSHAERSQHLVDASVTFVDGLGASRNKPSDCREGLKYITAGPITYWPLSTDDEQRLRRAECGDGEFHGPTVSHAEGEAVGLLTVEKDGDDLLGAVVITQDFEPGQYDLYTHPAPQVAFSDTQEEIEARLAGQLENSCPHCGGSGHKDDVTAPQVAVPEQYQLAAERYITQACRNAVEKLNELAPHMQWDSGDSTAEIYIRRLRAIAAATAGDIPQVTAYDHSIPTTVTSTDDPALNAPAPDERDPRLLGYTSLGQIKNENEGSGPLVTWTPGGFYNIPVYIGAPDEREIGLKWSHDEQLIMRGFIGRLLVGWDENRALSADAMKWLSANRERFITKYEMEAAAEAARLRAGKEGE